MMKALLPLKAAPLDDEQAWYAGRVPRRLLAIPFGGPIPSKASPIGVDLDGEWFSEDTDIFGNHRVLRQDRERLVDWHHRNDVPVPFTGRRLMSNAVIGKAILDITPEEEGWWVDFWFKAGEQRVGLIQKLAARGAQLFGSSEPVAQDVRKAKTGEITVWPFLFETLSTSPQSTTSVIRGKALLDDAFTAGISVTDAMRALITDVYEFGSDLAETLQTRPSAGNPVAKAGREISGANEAEIAEWLEGMEKADFASVTARIRHALERIRESRAP